MFLSWFLPRKSGEIFIKGREIRRCGIWVLGLGFNFVEIGVEIIRGERYLKYETQY